MTWRKIPVPQFDFFKCFYLVLIFRRNILGFLTRNVISILMNHSWVKCKDLDHFYWFRFLCYHLLQLDLWPRRIPNDTIIKRNFLQISKISKIDKRLRFQSKPKHLIFTNKATVFLILKTFSRRIQVLFFTIKEKLPMLSSKVFCRSKNSYLQWNSSWWSLVQGSNA